MASLVPVLSPILHRLFGGKPCKQAPVTTTENMKNSTVISNPHATLNHVGTLLESPDAGLGGVDSETSSPLFGGRVQGIGTLGSEQVSTDTKNNQRINLLRKRMRAKSSISWKKAGCGFTC